MRLPRYQAYRESGVPSLGRLPGHWSHQALKQVVAKVESGVSVNALDEPVSGSLFGVLKTSCVYSGQFDPTENKSVIEEELDRVACPVRAGALIVSRMNTPSLVGAAGLVKADADNLFLPDRLWQVHLAGTDPAFVHYWTASPSYRAQVEMACAGTSASMQNLSQEDFLRFAIPLPPLAEQVAVVRFLDRETAKIDALIAEQEKLIALLAEKRQATISHAVTRGLDSGVPMKRSGISWLGDVPAHWKVGKAGFYVSVLPGYAFPSSGFSLDESDVRLLRGINVAVEQLRWDDVVYWRRAAGDGLEMFELHVGDLVIGMDRPLISAGMRVAMVKATDLPCLLLQRVAKIVAGPGMEARYFMRLLSSRLFEAHFAPEATGVSVPHISGEQITNFVIPVPSLQEQQEIAQYLDDELTRLSAIEEGARRAVALFAERRSALITAAVTGQIDVRSAVDQARDQRQPVGETLAP